MDRFYPEKSQTESAMPSESVRSDGSVAPTTDSQNYRHFSRGYGYSLNSSIYRYHILIKTIKR